MLTELVYLVLILLLIKTFGPLIKLIILYKVSAPHDYTRYGSSSGAWAVVTGASDGIGKAFAEALAKKGFNIVLVARNKEKLEEVAKNIEQNSSKQTKIVVIDFASANDENYQTLAASINDLDVGVLVNNVGISFEYPEYFLQVDAKRHQDIIVVDTLSQVKVTQVVLPLLVKKGRGLVLNISSISGCSPTPLLSTYSASKSFLNTFSQTLYSEYRSKGVRVECLSPAFVVSKLSKRRAPTLTVPTPEKYVSEALRTVGTLPLRAGYFIHDLIQFALSLPPIEFLMTQNKKMHEGIRSAALKKIQEKKEQKKY